jgi:hypothetical protein
MTLRKKLAAAALAVGIVTTGTIATAPAAQAYSAVDFRISRMYYASPFCWASVWIDYNWWEESWLGGSHRDYRAFYMDSEGDRGIYFCGIIRNDYILYPWSRG